MWIARDKNGSLNIFNSKPIRANEWWAVDTSSKTNVDKIINFMEINSMLFPNLKWEDEPIEVILCPKPTFENIQTNALFNAIFSTGEQEGKLCEEYGFDVERIIGDIFYFK